MLPTIKSEFRKLLTVRSTYIFMIVSLLVVALFAGYGDGFRASSGALKSPGALMTESYNAIEFAGLILSFVGILLVGHEYRYNTIMYTLTTTNRRLKVLGAKFLAVSVFAIVMGLVVSFFSPLCTILGAHFHGRHISPQHFEYWTVIWRCAFVGWGYAMYSFILGILLRNQVGSIVTFLLIPLLGENIIAHVFASTANYLPFAMLQATVDPTGLGNHTTTAHAATVSLTYVVVGLIVSSVLFLRRDAN
ncbi:MAG TPA: ABC transporter permease [Candidatus Saccharimonadales bacterium]|nr:ABC transporter permease [Candidatus Saccharimonadales bacterium]